MRLKSNRISQRLRIVLDDFDPEATADGLMQMTPEQFGSLKTIPPKTRQALEEMKARADTSEPPGKGSNIFKPLHTTP